MALENTVKEANIAALQKLIEAAEEDTILYRELAQSGAFNELCYHPRMKACHEKNADF